MSLIDYARDELKIAGLLDKDSDYNGMLGEAILRMIGLFAEEGHSGYSASAAIAIFNKLARFEPITPLTGEDGEWVHVHENIYQNNRCSRVFRDNGIAYDIEGKVFVDPDGSTWVNGDSRVNITFPYRPTTEYVKRDTFPEVFQ